MNVFHLLNTRSNASWTFGKLTTLALSHHHLHRFYFVMPKKPLFNLSQCPSFTEMSKLLMYVLNQHLILLGF
jgi:hypothetical protein